jgi:hypothetical protein
MEEIARDHTGAIRKGRVKHDWLVFLVSLCAVLAIVGFFTDNFVWEVGIGYLMKDNS